MPSVDVSSYADPGVNKLLGTASNDPTQALASAQGAMNLAGTAQVMKLRDVALSQSQLDLAKSKLGALNQVFGSLVADPSSDNFGTQLTEAVKQGVIDPDTAQRASSQVMTFGGDPSKIKAWATDHLNQNASHQQLMEQAYGTPTMLNNGAVSSPAMVRTGAQGGYSPAAGPAVVQQMGPGEAASPTTGPLNPDGSPTVISKGQFAQRSGQGGAATVTPFGAIAYPGRAASAPAASAGAAPPALVPAAPLTTPPPAADPAAPIGDSAVMAARGRLAAAQNADPSTMTSAQQQQLTADTGTVEAYQKQQATPPAAGGGPPPQAQASAPTAGPMTVGLAPGIAAAADQNAAANTAAGQRLQAGADQVPNMKSTIGTMEEHLANIDTGPHAADINALKAGGNVIAGAVGLPMRFNQKAIADQEGFRNGAIQLAQSQFKALGGSGTDSQLASAAGDVPNDTISKMGNQQLLALAKGNADALAVKNSAWQQWQQTHAGASGTYGSFSDDWNQHFSPRAFQLNYLTPDQRKEMVASMSKDERLQIKSAYNTAAARGWFNPQGEQP